MQKQDHVGKEMKRMRIKHIFVSIVNKMDCVGRIDTGETCVVYFGGDTVVVTENRSDQ